MRRFSAVAELLVKSLHWLKFNERIEYKILSFTYKRAVHIIFSFTRGMSYPNVLFVANLNSLKDRR